MKRIWAPWRKVYIKNIHQQKGCLFCGKFRSKKDRDNLVVFRSAHSFSILNLYPYQNGHVMIVPNRHVQKLEQLEDKEMIDLMRHLNRIQRLLEKSLRPEGFNIGINLGRVAGAGVLGHVHIHILPRWVGDHNFMPVFSDTKIISYSLKSLYDTLQHADQKSPRRKRN